MSENEAMHVKVTINDLYKEQQEMKQILIQLSAKLDTYGNLPERVRAVEKYQDENAWVPKIMWAALISGLGGFVTSMYQMITGA